MTKHQIEIVRRTWAQVGRIDPLVVGELFYTQLFEIAPGVKPMFRTPMAEQSKKLLAMISYVIQKLDDLEEIREEVAKLAQRHVKYGIRDEHYAVVGQALLWTLERGLDSYWNKEVAEAWAVCYNMISDAMIEASRSEEKAA